MNQLTHRLSCVKPCLTIEQRRATQGYNGSHQGKKAERILGFCHLFRTACVWECVCTRVYACPCDYSPVKLIMVIEGNQADVYPAQGKQGNQHDQCTPTTRTLWRQNTFFFFKRLALQAFMTLRLRSYECNQFCDPCGESMCVGYWTTFQNVFILSMALTLLAPHHHAAHSKKTAISLRRNLSGRVNSPFASGT